MTNLNSMPPDEIVRRLIDLAAAVRDQTDAANAETLAETARAVIRRMPDHRFWGGMGRCPEEPMVDLMRQTMNGDGYHATTAGEIRAAARARSTRHTPFELLGGHSLVPLPRDLPEDDNAPVLLYNGARGMFLSAIGRRDDDALAAGVEWVLRELRRAETRRARGLA